MNKVFLYLLFATIAFSTHAQIFRGRVIDAKSRQSLPFVSVLQKGTQNGALTDIDGKFLLKAADSTQTWVQLQIQYLGYEPQTIATSTFSDKNNIVIKLQPQAFSLQEITVKAGENPAHRIIKKTIKNRAINNPEKMHSFTYDSYTKFFVTADLKANIDSVSTKDTLLNRMEKFFKNQHLFLVESVTRREFLKPNKSHETVLASRVSGLKNSPFALLATQLQSFSFYDDFVSVLDEKYVNPISEGSTRKYFFLLEDTLYSGKDTVFVISFKPRKNKNFSALKGVLYINTNTYAIQNVIAEPERKDKSISIKIQQKYEYIEGKQWFPVQLNTDWIWSGTTVSTSDTSKGGTRSAPLKSVSRTYIKDIVLNPELKKKIFSEVEVEMDKHSDRQDESFWNQYRTDTLSSKERKTYHTIDSIGKEYKFERKLKTLEALMTNKLPIWVFDLDLDRILRMNNYEYARLGLGLHTNKRLSKWFTVGGYFGYGFKDRAWKYGADGSVFLWRKKELALNALYQKDITESAGTNFFENNRNLMSSELYRDLFVSMYDKIEKYQASLSFRMLKYIRANVFANHQQRFGKTLFKTQDNAVRDTFQYNEVGVQLKFLYKEKFIETINNKLSLGSDYPVFYVNITKGMNQPFFNQKGDFNYWKFDFKMDAQKTFLTIGTSRVQLVAGKIIGNLPYTMLYNMRGSWIKGFELSAINSFETMGVNEFTADQYAALFFNHNIGRFLKPRKKFNPEIELVHNMGWGTLSNPENIFNVSTQSPNKGYFESGFRILHIIKISATTFGVGAFYRYGAYTKPHALDDITVKMVLAIKI
ncbi:MAG: carboxypeptidase-like regulatory domain-containing protein [Bacteroidetes bacterium]|nr:carboxypeptidase-like regulatory domain-containing protein [Bacteroidota bacterium]